MKTKAIHIEIGEDKKNEFSRRIKDQLGGRKTSSYIATLIERELKTKDLHNQVENVKNLLNDFRRKFDVNCTYEDIDKLISEILKLNVK